MSGLVLDTFWRSLHGLPLRVQKEVDHYRHYWRSVQDPVGGNPLDGTPIRWTCQQFLAREKRSGGRVLHLGTSESDGKHWRYEFGEAEKIEPATAEDVKLLLGDIELGGTVRTLDLD